MKITKDWLDIHLETSKSEKQIIDKLNSINKEDIYYSFEYFPA